MSERGYTLVELLVGATVALIVFTLVGGSLVAFQRGSSRSTRENQSQDQARVTIDRIVRQLRNVAGSRTAPTLIEAAGEFEVVLQTVDPAAPGSSSANSAGLSRVRYCIPPDPAPADVGNAAVFAQTQTWTTAATPPNPWPAPTACPSTPASVPSGSAISTVRVANDVVNRYAGTERPAFSYDSATPSEITKVGIELLVDVSPAEQPGPTELRSAAFLRNQNQMPVAVCTATATGSGRVLLNGGGSSDPDNQRLSFTWYQDGSGTSIGTAGLLDYQSSPGSRSFQLVVTDAGGLSATQNCDVVVT